MYNQIKAAVVGSLNTDITLTMDRMPSEGENLTGREYFYSCGGKGGNQAIALARLGASVKMIGKVGPCPNGLQLIDNLRNNGVDVSAVATDGTQTGLAAILLDKNGKNRIVVYEGANAEIDPLAASRYIDKQLDLLLIQFETAQNVVLQCVRQGIANGICTVVDCGPAKAFPLEEMKHITILSPNESETFALCGIYPDNYDNMLAASQVLMQRSEASFVVLKLGEKGCSVWDGLQLRIIPSLPASVADTTAAGDSFTAAMSLEYVRTKDIYKACEMGNKAGAFAVSRLGAQQSMPYLQDLL